ncbi:MAG TPA: TetR/AcrR family transcriptional regulator [Aggregatilineaceae bacterium]|nr:TetR/AcrR family transcriptional regulator [Aggregatilineaceae bacterium]
MLPQNDKRTDRRVQRTHQLLRDSLIELSLEKGYDDVTIQEITDRANLGRATFYLHYRDKDDLLLQTLQEIVDDLLQQVGPQMEGMFLRGDIAPLLTVFHHAEEHRVLYQIILQGRGASTIEHRLREYTASRSESLIEKLLQGDPSPLPIEIAGNYIGSSLLGLVEWWLEKDMPYTAEYMAQLFFDLCITSIMRALGKEQP